MIAADARTWLPTSAFALEQGQRAYGPVLEAWSKTWFATATATVGGIGLTAPERAHVQDIVVERARAEARLGPRGKRLLFETICAVDLSALDLGDSEHKLIEALAREAVADLLERTGGAEVSRDEAEEPPVSIGVSLGGRELLTFAVCRAAFAAKLKSVLPRQPHPRPPLVRRHRALGPTKVPLEAYVGRGSLTLAELPALTIGDIVLLDQPVEDGVTLAIAGTATPLIRGRLGRNGNRPAINL